jgi:hypothetical protein
MKGKFLLQVILAVWVLWHVAFGLLATVAPELGARITGWAPEGGWSSDLVSMSTQYGMVMLVLGGFYAVMLSDPLKYLNLLWAAIGELALGVLYAFYIYTAVGNITAAQLTIQGAANLLLMILLYTLWVRLSTARDESSQPRGQAGEAPAAT